jgi:hypothetical protein
MAGFQVFIDGRFWVFTEGVTSTLPVAQVPAKPESPEGAI